MSNSTLLNTMKAATNYEYTTNGAVAHKTTGSKVLDMFATGAAMRERNEDDVILLFKNAMAEDEVLALKCLFWIRDIRGIGQGERRFFRVCMKWLANYNTDAALRNMQYVSEFGRWDDLYAFVGTKCEAAAFKMIHDQLMLDLDSKTPSLLGKWLKSENASSKTTRALGDITRKHLKMTHKQYRKMLSILRTRINIVEKLMSENRWDEIEFDKIPSKAGLIYKNAFARRDIIKEKYEKFAKDENTTVNAGTLYPYEVVERAINVMGSTNYWSRGSKPSLNDIDRLMVNKYWDNLTDYFKGATLNALCMIDTSGSMEGTPINVATSLGLYCAERAGGPFANHYISFSSHPQLIETIGVDFCDKVDRIVRTNLCENTNIEAAFDLVLKTALAAHCEQSDLPEYILVVSDMQFDGAQTYSSRWSSNAAGTLMENIAKKWNLHGYEMPKLIYWNVNAYGKADIPMIAGNVSFVSGFSPSIFQSILTGKTGYDLMIETLNNSRYNVIH